MRERIEPEHIDRSVGEGSGTEMSKEGLEYFLAEGGRRIEEFEIEKGEREIEIINFVDQALAKYHEQYGRQKKLVFPKENTHILKDGGLKEYSYGSSEGGAHSSKLGSVVVDRVPSDILFATILFHEKAHMNAYQAIQSTTPNAEGEQDITMYRGGFEVASRDGKVHYFKDIEEALVAHLSERFIREKILPSSLFDENPTEKEIKEFTSREWEQSELNELVDDLWQNNQAEYTNRDEIMELFIEAQITGKLLKVARLIEKTYGKGSFREMGELTSEKVED